MIASKFAMLLAGLLLASPVLADTAKIIAFPDKADSIVVPAGSPLHLHAFDPQGNDAASFDGKMLLSGKFYLSNNLDLMLEPDRATLARLPHLKHHGWGEAFKIELSSSAAFAHVALPPAALAAIKKKGDDEYASGKIGIWADRFRLRLACDEVMIDANFVSVASPPGNVAGATYEGGDC
jgi:hypothetical protein